ncbi:MAG: hypothetical protein UT84_C0053G0006 [Candidatus Curtissbacteria bacterium GW2011_GWA1_40_16]|uniref:DUF5652 domain-containing protein n=1 Tax=Candidatus Curtissbacteria bacterium GW2011_GWA1_40_16 TaxID=1618405 RepID=A0A0G0TLK8_9BACT|nr:MAG: hypothetical protein UT84_C0053G0006 [Candidatus Curtissbacteria bacterium GW2011_GWA1_40_16]
MDSFIRDLILSNNIAKDPRGAILLAVLVIWSLIFKGAALWHAAKNAEKIWFIAILLLNTAGIAEIAYLFFFSKDKLVLKDLIENAKSLNIKTLIPQKVKK